MSKSLEITNRLLGDIAMAMSESSYEMDWYLDLQKEGTTFLGNPAMTGEYEYHEKLKKQIDQDTEGRFMSIPRISSDEAWQHMENFILSLDDRDESVRNQLLDAIQGKGAFSRFKDAIHELGLRERWFESRDRQKRKAVLEWLYSADLITEQQIDRGMEMYEELIQKKKRRKKEIANMTEGKQVKCLRNNGHEDSLTTGEIYNVRDEQPQHLNIRIKDDHGNIIGYPKAILK